MCLITRINNVHKTTQPIVCYKVLTEDLISPYQDFQYQLNKFYDLESSLEPEINHFDYNDIVYEIHHGFHAYIDIEYAKITRDSLIYYFNEEYQVFECEMPAGSEVAYGIDTDIVSNQLIIKKQI